MKRITILLALSFLISYTAWATDISPARDFEGSNSEYFSLSNASQIGLDPGANSWYFCAWVNQESTRTSDDFGNILFGKGGGGSVFSYSCRIKNGNNLRLYIYDGSTFPFIDSADSITNGVWAFVEYYHDASAKTLSVCINRGTDTTSSAYAGTAQTSTNIVEFGNQSGGSQYYDGLMQGAIFISGIPSTSERNALYNSGNGVLYANRPTLASATYVSFWNGDEASGDLIDSVGTNNFTDNNTVTSGTGHIPIDNGGSTWTRRPYVIS